MHPSQAPGVVGPFAGLDVPWLLAMRAEVRRDHPFLIWAPFDAPARKWSYGEFHARVGALAAGLVKRGIRQGDYVLIHLDNCIETLLAWFACVELGAIAVTTNTRSAAAEIEYFAGHCGAVAAITQPAYAELVATNCKGLRWIAVTSHDAGMAANAARADSFESLFADSADRPRRAGRSPRALQRAIHLRHHVAAEGGAMDPRQCAVGRQGQCRASGPARRRRAPDLSAAVSHQCTGLFDAGEPLGRWHLRHPAALLGKPLLARGAGARLDLDLHHPLLHEGAARARDSQKPQIPAVGQRR